MFLHWGSAVPLYVLRSHAVSLSLTLRPLRPCPYCCQTSVQRSVDSVVFLHKTSADSSFLTGWTGLVSFTPPVPPCSSQYSLETPERASRGPQWLRPAGPRSSGSLSPLCRVARVPNWPLPAGGDLPLRGEGNQSASPADVAVRPFLPARLFRPVSCSGSGSELCYRKRDSDGHRVSDQEQLRCPLTSYFQNMCFREKQQNLAGAQNGNARVAKSTHPWGVEGRKGDRGWRVAWGETGCRSVWARAGRCWPVLGEAGRKPCGPSGPPGVKTHTAASGGPGPTCPHVRQVSPWWLFCCSL